MSTARQLLRFVRSSAGTFGRAVISLAAGGAQVEAQPNLRNNADVPAVRSWIVCTRS